MPQATNGIAGGSSTRLAVFILVVLLVGGLVVATPSAGSSRALPRPKTFSIGTDFDLTKVADLPGACGFFAVRLDANDLAHYVYVANGALYYGVEGSGSPVTIASGSVECDDVDLAFKPDGSAVVGWIDVRNAYASSRDGSSAGWDLFVASEDSGWAQTLVTASSNQRVQTFRMGVDSHGVIHVVYTRFEVADFPYNPAVFYSKSPQWQEVAVSGALVWSEPSMAIDSRDRIHVAWSYWGDLENVWYASSANGWTNVRVDQNQSSNWWDDRKDPSIAVDSRDVPHVVWDDYRNTDTTWMLNPNRVEIWAASPSDGWVNRELVVPDDAAPTRTKMYPSLTIDATDAWHVTWNEFNDSANLYYANSTDWNHAVKFTNSTSALGYSEIRPPHPVDARTGRLTVLFSDSRTGYPVLWRKDDWDLGPDVTPPVAGPLTNRTFGVSRGGHLQAVGSWDNDRIVSYDWRFVGPATVLASGYDAWLNFSVAGRYAATLTVRDPAGYEASTNFTVDALPEPSTIGWILDRTLTSVLTLNGKVTLFPWDGTGFPVIYGDSIYIRIGLWGEFLSQTTFQQYAYAPRETSAIDAQADVHSVGFHEPSLMYRKDSPTGTNLIPDKPLPLNGSLPQRPYLTYDDGALWLAWRDQRDGNFEIYIASLDLNGNLLWGPTRISNNSFTSDYPILAATRSSLWIIWTDERDSSAAVYASRLNTTSMTFDFQERRLGDGFAWDAKALASGGIAWLGGEPWGEPYVASADASGALTAPIARPSLEDGQGSISGAIAVDAHDNVHAIWWDAVNGNASSLRYGNVSTNGSVDPAGGMRVHAVLPFGDPSMSVVIGPDDEPRIAYAVGTPSGSTLFAAAKDPTPPVAHMAVSGTLRAGAAIILDGSGSTDNVGIGSYRWSVRNSTGAEQIYTGSPATIRLYAGVYAVQLEVFDLAGNPANASTNLSVAPDTVPPTAVIHGPTAPAEREVATYDGLGSTDDGAIESYHWTVTGPAAMSGDGATFAFVFPVHGNYTVRLDVTDFGGNVASATAVVRVRDAQPPSVVATVPTAVYEGTEVTFDASASSDDTGIARFDWSVADGGTVVAQLQGSTVQYRFGSAGVYQVTVTVTDVTGNTASRTFTVTVRARSYDPAYRLAVGIGFTLGGAAAGAILGVALERLRRRRNRNTR